MTAYKDRSKEELLQEKSQLEAQYKEFQGKGLKLDMSRGKPSAAGSFHGYDGCTGQLYRSEV